MTDVGTITIPVTVDFASMARQLREAADKIDPPTEPPAALSIPWPPGEATVSKISATLEMEFGQFLAHDPYNPDRFWNSNARAVLDALGGDR